MTFHSNRPERPQMPERRKRNPGNINGISSLPYYRDGSGPEETNSSSSASWEHGAGQDHLRHRNPLEHFNYFDVGASTLSTSASQFSINHDDDQIGAQAPPSSLISSDTFSFDFPLSQYIEPNDGFLSHSSPESAAWQPGEVFTPTSSHMGSQYDDNPLSDGQTGSYGSLNGFPSSNALSSDQPGSYGSLSCFPSSSPEALASGFSENFGILDKSTTWGSPLSDGRILEDLNMSNDCFEIVSHSPHSFARESSREPPSEGGNLTESAGWNTLNGHTTGENVNWTMIDSVNLQFSGAQDHADLVNQPHVPWNPEYPQHGEVGVNAGTNAFVPQPEYPHDIFKHREGMFRSSNPVRPYFSSQGSFLVGANDHDQKQPSSRHEVVPHAYDSESSLEPLELHEHVFSVANGSRASDKYRGRKRKLTTAERERTLEVRKDGACWACHLLKTKCSPCSSGSPCEQCTRLVGKRRFCLLSCFNDSIESLHTFLVPHWLFGHFNKANVEAFIGKHSIQCGTHEIPVRMSWGCRTLLNVKVVALSLLGDSSELAYNHQAITNENGVVELVRNKCAPLGINMADIDDMRNEFRVHISDVVDNDLPDYVSIAYDDQSSKLAERLLEAVCTWYQRGVGDDEEHVLLRRVIEIHIASTILESSLILDEASIHDVREHLGHEYPILSAPRGAQRQIKLAIFMEQRPRIVWVLKQWGKLMRSTTRAEKNWQTAFCVFIMLTLIMDKTIMTAHYFCEGRIKFRGRDAKSERETFENLRRLMETSLFERCKEIFHCRYKTRKGGNERCNPIRDGTAAWRGEEVDGRTAQLIDDIQLVVRDFVPGKVRGDRRPVQAGQVVFSDLGRLARTFLSDF